MWTWVPCIVLGNPSAWWSSISSHGIRVRPMILGLPDVGAPYYVVHAGACEGVLICPTSVVGGGLGLLIWSRQFSPLLASFWGWIRSKVHFFSLLSGHGHWNSVVRYRYLVQQELLVILWGLRGAWVLALKISCLLLFKVFSRYFLHYLIFYPSH